ncbi:MAG: acyl-CoA thioesterase [Acetivibrionales bacterium]
MVTETCFPVRFIETDLLGIVHHSNYLIWFEIGRSDYFKKAGIPIHTINALGLYLPVLKTVCDFKCPAKHGDEIMVNTRLVYLSCVKVKFEYKVINKLKGNILAAGNTVHAWTNKRLEPLNLEKAAPEIYYKIKQLVESTFS